MEMMKDLKDVIIEKQENLIDLILYDPSNDVRIPLDVKVRLAINEIDELKLKLKKIWDTVHYFQELEVLIWLLSGWDGRMYSRLNGIPGEGLGNAIVPQIVFEVFKAIENVDKY
jgi:hypothetical protein